jgi:hypothetical protein
MTLPRSKGIRKNLLPPRYALANRISYYAAPDSTACAAFSRESRMTPSFRLSGKRLQKMQCLLQADTARRLQQSGVA